MKSDWETTTLGTLGDFRNGVNFNREQEGHGLPVLKVKDFGDRVLCPLDSLDELNSALFQASPQQLLAENDIVVIRSNGNPALVGRSVVVQKVARPTTFSGFCIRFRPDSKRIDPRFAAYFLRSPLARDRMTRFGSGTGIQNLNQDILSGLPIDLPELDEQIAISDVLVTLDDKIEQNRRTGRKLEALARAVFKAWFVDFEPVKAKAAGSTAFPGMPPETFTALPNTLQDSPLGRVPEGWEVRKIRDLCLRVENGGTPKRQVDAYWSPPEVPWLTSGEVRQSFVMKTESFISKAGLDNSSSKLWPRFTTVVALYGATAGIATMLGTEVCANQACCGLLPRIAKCFVHQVLSNSLVDLQQRARGSAQQNLSQSIVADFECVTASDTILPAFERFALPLYEICMHLAAESAKLATLRDYLLPRLLSGRVRVGAAGDGGVCVDDGNTNHATDHDHRGGGRLAAHGRAAGRKAL